MNDNGLIKMPELFFTGQNLEGNEVGHSVRTLGDIISIFEDRTAVSEADLAQIAYSVSSALPVKEGTAGGLFFGITRIMPGKVGDEYFMTKGHFHRNSDTAEFYWCVEGEGVLILMDMNRNVWAEKMFPGSLHYIPGNVAHRVANVGVTPLVFDACWPSDAGHNYEEIAMNGFAMRLKEVKERPVLVRGEK